MKDAAVRRNTRRARRAAIDPDRTTDPEGEPRPATRRGLSPLPWRTALQSCRSAYASPLSLAQPRVRAMRPRRDPQPGDLPRRRRQGSQTCWDRVNIDSLLDAASGPPKKKKRHWSSTGGAFVPQTNRMRYWNLEPNDVNRAHAGQARNPPGPSISGDGGAVKTACRGVALLQGRRGIRYTSRRRSLAVLPERQPSSGCRCSHSRRSSSHGG
jgi:hypothetical protein